MLKNKVEYKGDIALIHVNSKGTEQIVIVDIEDLPFISRICKNKLNIDSSGFVQHRKMKEGKWEVTQLHRLVSLAFPWEIVGFKNGNKLDCRKENLLVKDTLDNEIRPLIA